MLLLLLFAISTTGWWQMGHVITAKIAYDQLIGENDRRLLDEMAVGDGLFGFSPNFVESAVWADDLKAYGLSAFDQWHYVNTPFVLGNATGAVVPVVNIGWAIPQMVSTWRSKNGVDGSRAFALRMLVHLVGDASQPMHCVTLFSSIFPNGDQGGNRFMITTPTGQKVNLHSFFDSGAMRLNGTISQPMSSEQIFQVEQYAQNIATAFPPEDFDPGLLSYNVSAWLQDSYEAGVRFAYLNGALSPGSVVNDEYVDNVYNATLRGIALGGYRLAGLIQKYLKGVPVPAPPPSSSSMWVILISCLFSFILGGVIGGAVLHYFQKRNHSKENDLLMPRRGIL